MNELTYLNTLNLHAVEQMYQQYLAGSDTISGEWRAFFDGFQLAHSTIQPKTQSFCSHCLETEFRVINLIEAYRQRGHLFTKTNPVRVRRKYLPTLDIVHFGLQESHLEQKFRSGALIGVGQAKLSDIIQHLKDTYCASVGCEYAHVRFTEQVDWLKERIEPTRNRSVFKREEKLRIFRELAEAVIFEQFVTRSFLGQKSFSLEGEEALIPSLHVVLEHGANLGARDFQIGMAHRGRLNVLVNIMRKPLPDMFAEFIGKYPPELFHYGDVKYHKGYSNNFNLANGKSIYVNLAPNPSHLEAVGGIVEGMARARLDLLCEGDRDRIVPILIHGDAAMAAQGVVYEVVQMAGLSGYDTGGTIHVALNNQIGFTTNYLDARTSVYCTDIAKVTGSPVFHVNADDVEAFVHVMRIAIEFRQRFHRDVFVDLLGYRRHGHNETDEPKYTQPLLYRAIESHLPVLDIYRQQLLSEDRELVGELDACVQEVRENLKSALDHSKATNHRPAHPPLAAEWKDYREPMEEDFLVSPDTGVEKAILDQVASAITSIPADFPVFEKTKKVFDGRREAYFTKDSIDWAFAELLSFGSLIREGVAVRLSGQDCERGTFSQRHGVLMREDSEEKIIPLNSLAKGHARFQVFNSPLSEYGVLGFEIGYSMADPRDLILWEAQFGDFVNNAQSVIDTFLCASRTRWSQMTGITLLLPHGYEGQGAEHSSARFERFLQLCACRNMQVVIPSTPANYFHVLRRQVDRAFRLPLIVMTPKSLLRNPACTSSTAEMVKGRFLEVIDDVLVDSSKVTKVLLCSGKIYYDLKAEREKQSRWHVALVRLEQLYPLPKDQLGLLVKKYHGARWCWVQEEPWNMGAHYFLKAHWSDVSFDVMARPEADTPATGHYSQHILEQEEIFKKALE